MPNYSEILLRVSEVKYENILMDTLYKEHMANYGM
jgi:hypothetical protein